MLKGSFVALITPFRDGKVDYEQFEKLIEFHIENGTHGLLPCGTTGESATLSHEEHREVIRFTVKQAARRIKVLAGTGSNSTREAIRLAEEAAGAGADAHLSITPYYNKPTQEGLFQHFTTIADQVDLPMLLYNVPGRTSVNLQPSTIARLAKHRNIVGIKEATGNVRQSIEILEQTGKDFLLFSGDDFINFPLLTIGAVGSVSVTANILPREMSNLYEAYWKGDIEKALDIHYSLMPVHRSMFLETNPIPVKQAAFLMGILSHLEYRKPMVSMAESSLTELRKVLQEKNLI